MDTFSSIQKLLGRILVPEQKHLLQPEHLQLDDVSGGHGHQDLGGRGMRQPRRLSGVLLQKCLKHNNLKNMYLDGMRSYGMLLEKLQRELSTLRMSFAIRKSNRYQLNSMFTITSKFMIYDLFQVSNELVNVYKLDALGGVHGDVPQVPAGPRCLLL